MNGAIGWLSVPLGGLLGSRIRIARFAASPATFTLGSPPRGIELNTKQLNATSATYEIVSWTALVHAGDDVTIAINIVRLREVVAAADKDWALLVAREGGAA